MNWSAMSAVADLLASVGVIISLIYVAVQLKQNSKVAGASNYQQNMELISGASALISGSSELTDIYNRGCKNYYELNENELTRFHMMMSNFVLPIQMNIHMKNRGLMEDQLYLGQIDSFLNLFHNPGIRDWWNISKKWFHQDFVRQIDMHVQDQHT